MFAIMVGFNPCFNGIDIQTGKVRGVVFSVMIVSILVLMESTFRLLCREKITI